MNTLSVVRQSLRGLRRDLRFTVPAVLITTLAFALGSGVFAVFRIYLLRALPFPSAERVMSVDWQGGEPDVNLPMPLAEVDWAGTTSALDLAVAVNRDIVTLVGASGAEQASGAWVSEGFFDMFGRNMAAGRPLDVVTGRGQEIVISYGFWRSRFGADPSIVGSSVRLSTLEDPSRIELATIVGVLPRDFWQFDQFFDVLLPQREPVLPGFVRLRPGVTPADASVQLAQVARRVVEIREPAWRVSVVPLRERVTARIRPVLELLLGGAVLLLLIAAANVAMLQRVRLDRRHTEFAVRRALGAGRLRIVVHQVTEIALVVGCAAGLGLWISWAGLAAAAAAIQGHLNVPAPGSTAGFRPDLATILGVMASAGALSALLAAPLAFRARRPELGSLGRIGSIDRRTASRSLTGGLIVAQLGLSLALLVNAGLMVTSAYGLRHVDTGFTAPGLGVARIALPEPRYADDAQRAAFFRALLAGLRAEPDVEEAAIVNAAPFRSRANPGLFRATNTAGEVVAQRAATFFVTPRYFRTMAIALAAGVPFDDQPGSAMVSASFAKRAWPGQDAIGRMIRPSEEAPLRVVGVVEDVLNSLTDPDAPEVYLPLLAAPWSSVDVVVRTRSSGGRAVAVIRTVVTRLDPDLPLGRPELLTAAVRRQTGRADLLAALLLVFAGAAVVLVVVALYGAISYAVSQRGPEIAVRLALGATPAGVETLFVRWGGFLVASGLVLGLVGAIPLSRLLTTQLYGVAPTEPRLYGGLCLMLGAVSFAAVWLPARRASRLDPMRVFRA